MKTVKRFLSLFLAAAVIMCASPLGGFVGLGLFSLDASAAIVDSGECGDNLTWTLDDAGLLTVSGTGEMNSSAFAYTTDIKKAVIKSGVTSIGNSAFYGCKGLTSIIIPGSVTKIGNLAFFGCTGLTSIKVDKNNSRYDSRNDCNAIIETDTNTLIAGCKSTVIPNSVTSIGYDAFYGCTGLTSITIPNSVTSIGGSAFYGCTGLTSITIPSSVTSIGNYAFSGCAGLTSIKVDKNNSVYDSRNDCNAIIETDTNTLIAGCKSTVIPNSVTSIGDCAFYDCAGLTSVTIPSSVTSIGDCAFSDCAGLTSIKVDKNNSVYDSRNDCNAIIETDTNTLIAGCKSTVIPDSVTSIGAWTFCDCTWLTSIIIPGSVTSIGYSAFSGCTGLTSITIPGSVTSIGHYAFSRCAGLTSIKIPSSVTSIGGYAFSGCTGLTSITIPGSVTSIVGCAFSGCTGLTSITIPNSVASIGWGAFSGCTGLTSIVIPDSVTSIGEFAFYGCAGLTSVTIPDSVTSIEGCAFLDCAGLTSIKVDKNNSVYDSRNDCNAIIETDTNTLIAGCKSTVIPVSVTSIEDGAFYGCAGLTSITIPSSVTSIGKEAFYGCTGLTSIVIPDSVTSIDIFAFYYCKGLTDVYYTGSEEQWKAISIAAYNEDLTNATIHYNTSNPETKAVFSDIIIKDKLIFLKKGETFRISAYSESGEDITDNVEWSSSSSYGTSSYDTDIVSITASGTITAKANGLTTVFAHTADMSIDESCYVYVGESLNEEEYSSVYDSKYFYSDGGFYSTHSGLSDCAEFYFSFKNRPIDEVAFLAPYETYKEYFKEIGEINIRATISGSDLSFERDRYVNTYSATLDSTGVMEMVEELLMLFPYNYNDSFSKKDYTLTVTISSDSFDTITENINFSVENLAEAKANTYVDYINSNTDYRISKKNTYGAMVDLKHDAEYLWDKYTSLDFDNYYEIVVGDLIVNMLNVGQFELVSIVPELIKDWKGYYKDILDGVNTIVEDSHSDNIDITKIKLDKILKGSKYSMNNDAYSVNDELYHTVIDLFGNVGNVNKITKVFEKFDTAKMAVSFYKTGKNVLNDIIDVGNKIAVYNAFTKADKEFKTVFSKLASTLPNGKMKEAVMDYVNYSSGADGAVQEITELIEKMTFNIGLEAFKALVGFGLRDYIGAGLAKWISTATVKGVAIGSTSAGLAMVNTVVGSIGTGIGLGLVFSDILCDTSGVAKEEAKTIAIAEYSPYVIDTLIYFENYLNKNKNDTAAAYYEYAFALHKATQEYLINQTIKSLETKRDTLLMGIFGKRDDYNDLIAEIILDKTSVSSMTLPGKDEVFNTAVNNRRCIAIKCPVDICVYDDNETLVAQIKDDSLLFSSDEINVIIIGSEKFLIVPMEKEYSVVINATDNGKMTYAVYSYDENDNWNTISMCSDIALTVDAEFEGEIPQDKNAISAEYLLKKLTNKGTSGDCKHQKAYSIAQVNATCITSGVTEYRYCPNCKCVLDDAEIIPNLTEHTYDTGKITQPATCKSTGIMTFTCSVCKTTKTEVIPKSRHKSVTDKAVPATCTAAGKTAGAHCSVCGTVLTAQTTVPATGHKWDNGKITAEPTYEKDGVKTFTCSVCKQTKSETVPKLVKTYTLGDVDGDGKITSADARLALRASVGLKGDKDAAGKTLDFSKKTNREFLSADYDKNGAITSADARSILRVSVGLTP